MSVVILDNKRIFLESISKYEIGSDKLYHRNDKEEERILFFWPINTDDLWSEYSFRYLYIKMFNGKKYRFFSDKKLYDLLEYMENYFIEEDIGDALEDDNSERSEEILEEDEHLRQAVESYLKIKKRYKYIKEDILDIANRLDNAFGTI